MESDYSKYETILDKKDPTANIVKKFYAFDIAKAFNDGFDIANTFIDVNVSLPNLYTKVFLKSSNTESYFTGYLNENNKFVGDDFKFENFIDLDITHWRYAYVIYDTPESKYKFIEHVDCTEIIIDN